MPETPDRFPDVAFRVGIDLDPIDLRLRDDEQYGWLQALIWPDHADRAALLANARRVWLQDTPRVAAGDALAMLPNQFPVSARAAFSALLRSTSRLRPVYHVASEGERMDVTRIVNGRSQTKLSVLRSAHGRWVQWSDG